MSDLPESDRRDGFPHPRETRRLYGHKAAEGAFLDAYRAGRVHHAWLLTGIEGVGKATLAYRIARFVLSHPDTGRIAGAGITLDMVDEQVARQIAGLSHPNLLVLRRPTDETTKRIKTVIPVEEVRRVTHFLSRSASAGGWRISLIDSVDDLNSNAANALLKMLEEPPANCLFLLVSHHPGRLLPTIRSRCRRLALKPLDQPTIHQILAHQIGDLGDDALGQLCRLADGSAGIALSMAAADGVALYDELSRLLGQLPRVDVRALHQLADRVGRRDADGLFHLFFNLLSAWIDRLVRVGAGAGGTELMATSSDLETMARLASMASLDRWVEVWEKIGQSLARAEALNMDRKVLVINTFSDLESVCLGEALPA